MPLCTTMSVLLASFIRERAPQPSWRGDFNGDSASPDHCGAPASSSTAKPSVRTNLLRYSAWPSRNEMAWIIPSPSNGWYRSIAGTSGFSVLRKYTPFKSAGISPSTCISVAVHSVVCGRHAPVRYGCVSPAGNSDGHSRSMRFPIFPPGKYRRILRRTFTVGVPARACDREVRS